MNWYIQAYKKRYEFAGRSGRSEFWYFTLASALTLMGILLIDMK